MRKGYHRIPIVEHEGRNPEEKEDRHDLDKRLIDDREARNMDAGGDLSSPH
ncbi:MAG TPA: hypothetical protein VFD89_09645 [Clostridia bacterium]|nr:hypothetical protein [Clostridia bacterium]